MAGLRNRPGAPLRVAPTLALLAAVAAAGGCASLPAARGDERLLRVESLAILQTLNADLLSHDSATLTLERWCADHALAAPARIVARRLRVDPAPIPPELRAKLDVGADAHLGYRHVQLACGDRVLSEADNWYVPERLTPQMNRTLDTTDEPFGKVVRALGFQRRTLAAELLWTPLPPHWDRNRLPAHAPPLRVPHALLRHTALLYDAQRRPFSAVVETYTNQTFAFGAFAPLLEAQ